MEGSNDITKLGRSLLVPSVKELAKECLTTVPPRYVRPHQDLPFSSSSSSSSYTNSSDHLLQPQIPVIDLTKLSSEDFKSHEIHKLHQACQQWGFFQLINHGVDDSVIEKMKKGIQEFFNLPLEEKKKYWQTDGDIEGFGQAFVVSEEQKLDWSDLFYFVTLPPSLRKPQLFPKLPLPFRDDLETYSSEMRKLALKILEAMVEALEMDPKEMKELFEEGWQGMRMNYYPPCPQPELVTGINPHSDGVGLTILLQVNQVEGLQIRKDSMWVPIAPLPNAFIVNIGDILEVVTNGMYKSIEHRAIVNSEKERISVATFYSPKMDGEMGPARSLVSPERPALFRKIGVAEFFRGYFSQELNGKSYLDVMRI